MPSGALNKTQGFKDGMSDRTIPPSNVRKHRAWKKGDRSKISVMHVFRSAFIEHDARKAAQKSEDGSAQISSRSKQRRHGVSEDTLRAHIQADLVSLMNTIRLDSTVSLEDAPYVARSIANYGFQDLSNCTVEDLQTKSLISSIRQSLLDHEPRMIPETVEVKLVADKEDAQQRLSIAVSAELMGDPVDIPIDFAADVDLGAGKMAMSSLKVHQ